MYLKKLNKKNNNNVKINENLLKKKIKESYELNGHVNINYIESKITKGRFWEKNKDVLNEINIGIQLDPSYVLRGMMTLASIMDSSKPKTKLRFHIAVVLSFSIDNMLKIYSLREKIRNDVEFNYYNAERVETELKNLNSKGPGAVAKLLLPELLEDNFEKLIIFDTGDLLVLRDLNAMYNLNMNEYLYLGIPGGKIGKYAKISKKKYKRYINTGSMLVNIKKVKKEKIYEKCVKHKKEYNGAIGDQDLLNDIAFGKIGYLPMKFGIKSPYKNDLDSDKIIYNIPFHYLYNVSLKDNSSFIPKKINKIIQLGDNPIVIHQFNGKWMNGQGMTVYRRISQYYIKLAGIWDEICIKYPGYCLK
jgi:lipopolysaccharide biosynthesis glycosyltransferase